MALVETQGDLFRVQRLGDITQFDGIYCCDGQSESEGAVGLSTSWRRRLCSGLSSCVRRLLDWRLWKMWRVLWWTSALHACVGVLLCEMYLQNGLGHERPPPVCLQPVRMEVAALSLLLCKSFSCTWVFSFYANFRGNININIFTWTPRYFECTKVIRLIEPFWTLHLDHINI